MQRNTVNDFFCGAGGIGLGFKNEGYEIVGAWDYDKYAVESYKVNVDSKVKLMDITKMTASDVPYADVWTFGFPCQDLSYAGKQAGMIKGETRSGLFFEVMRLLEETNKKGLWGKPKVIMAENVKALKKYLPVLEEEYEKVGYKMYYILYNSKYWGVPQNRERYFVVGVREDLDIDFKFPEQQIDNVPKLISILEAKVDEKYYLSEEKSQKIIQRLNISKHNEPVNAPLRFLDRNQKEVQNISLCLDASQTNGVEEPNKEILGKCIDDQGRKKKELKPLDISPTLRAEEHGNTKKVIIDEPKIDVVGKLDIKGNDQSKRVYNPEGLSPTLTTSEGDNRQPKIVASRGRYNEEGKVEQNYEPRKDDVSNTLTSVQKDNLLLENAKTNEQKRY